MIEPFDNHLCVQATMMTMQGQLQKLQAGIGVSDRAPHSTGPSSVGPEKPPVPPQISAQISEVMRSIIMNDPLDQGCSKQKEKNKGSWGNPPIHVRNLSQSVSPEAHCFIDRVATMYTPNLSYGTDVSWSLIAYGDMNMC